MYIMDNRSGHDATTYVNKLYDNLSFFELNFQSILLVFFVTTIFIFIVAGGRIMSKSNNIKKNWDAERCKPNIIPLAGFINKPVGQTIAEYTLTNFNYCIKQILDTGFKTASSPYSLSDVTNGLMDTASLVDLSYNTSFTAFADLKAGIEKAISDVKNKFSNTMVPVKQSMYAMQDMFSRMQAIFIAGVYTSLGNSYIIKSLVQQMTESVSKIFYLLLMVITALFIIPGTQGLAVASTAVALPLLVAMASINITMARSLGIKPGNLPSIKKCFDKNTMLQMNSGEYKPINQIQIGDVLMNSNTVTATITLDSKYVRMYEIDGVIVSGFHKIKYNNEWTPVSKYPFKTPIINYTEPYIYCINTTNKIIKVNKLEFLDWDELFDEHLEKVLTHRSPVGTIGNKENIHKILDGGFLKGTVIKLFNKKTVHIQNIIPGDKLIDGSVVYGVVKIKSDDIKTVCEYNLGQLQSIFRGGSNLIFYDSRGKLHSTLNPNDILQNPAHSIHHLSTNNIELFHLLTDTQSFYVGNIKFTDYNHLIDTILKKSL